MYIEFIKFLKRYRTFSEFERSFKEYRKSTNTSINDFCNRERPLDYFTCAFPWEDSNKGFDFWNNLNNKWRKLLQNNEKEK